MVDSIFLNFDFLCIGSNQYGVLKLKDKEGQLSAKNVNSQSLLKETCTEFFCAKTKIINGFFLTKSTVENINYIKSK
jgi:hypothetical protein